MTEQPVNYIRTFSEPLAYQHTIRLDRELTTPSDFQEELTVIRSAGADDVLKVILNGPGGSDSVMKAILSSMAQFQGHIITEIEGDCCSALTPIFLAGDELRVSDDANFMIHTASFGYGGKENNVRQFVEFNAKANERLMKKYYKHYLTEDEIEQVIEGRDIWHDADQILARLEKWHELFQLEEVEAQQEAMEAELETMMGEPLPRDKVEALDKETLVRLVCQELSEEEEEALLSDMFSEEDVPTDEQMEAAHTLLEEAEGVWVEGECIPTENTEEIVDN